MSDVTFSYGFLIGGAIAAIGTGLRIASGLESLLWPSTTGRVLARDIDDTRQKYQPVLEYSYEVHGVPYRGHRISFDFALSRNDFQAATLLFHKYPPGKEVSVHYDPQRPYRSVLERGITWRLLVPLGIAIWLVVQSTP